MPTVCRGPTVSPAGGRAGARGASRTPGTYASRENASWRIVSSCPCPPSSTSWCATRPGSRTEWIGGSRRAAARPSPSPCPTARPASSRGGARRSPPRQVPRGLLGEAHHQDGPDREVRREEDRRQARRARLSVSQPLVPTTHGTPASIAARTFASAASGAVKSTIASASLELVDELVAGRFERRREHAADLSAAAVEEDPHAATGAAAPTSAGFTCSTASRNQSSFGPIPAAEKRSGASSNACELRDRLGRRPRRSRRRAGRARGAPYR